MKFNNTNTQIGNCQEISSANTLKNTTVKCSKIRKYISNKCNEVVSLKDKNVYLDVLNFASAKRSITKFCNKLFKNRTKGYDKLLTDEERRLTNNVDYISVVESV